MYNGHIEFSVLQTTSVRNNEMAVFAHFPPFLVIIMASIRTPALNSLSFAVCMAACDIKIGSQFNFLKLQPEQILCQDFVVRGLGI